MTLKARIKKNCSEKEFKRISKKYGKAIESIDEIRKIISSSRVNLSVFLFSERSSPLRFDE